MFARETRKRPGAGGAVSATVRTAAVKGGMGPGSPAGLFMVLQGLARGSCSSRTSGGSLGPAGGGVLAVVCAGLAVFTSLRLRALAAGPSDPALSTACLLIDW